MASLVVENMMTTGLAARGTTRANHSLTPRAGATSAYLKLLLDPADKSYIENLPPLIF
jgi:hypothetical protein